MNYANMIEEKSLKKTFIIATLVSTLVGTFTSSHNLYERLREKKKQGKLDDSQNNEIKKLRAELDEMKKHRDTDRDFDRSRERMPPKDALADSLAMSGAMIRREYDEGYARLGSRFAGGDLITENQLQAQVIALQQTVIKVLQDAIYNERQMSRSDIRRLLEASEDARRGSLDALRHQYQRLIAPAPSERGIALSERSAPGPALLMAPPSRASAPSVTHREVIPVRRPERDLEPPLFCRYSRDLQSMPRKPLSVSFAAGRGDGQCPACDVRLDVDSQDMWKITKHVPVLVSNSSDRRHAEERVEERVFEVGPRFVVKCHAEDGRYACLLCHQNRDVDVICATPEALIAHVGREHDSLEYEREPDLVETWSQLR